MRHMRPGIFMYAVRSPNMRRRAAPDIRHVRYMRHQVLNMRKKNHRTITEDILRTRCVVNVQGRRQRRRASVECT